MALSSGAPPAAIAIIRISGTAAFAAAEALAGVVPPPRQAALRTLRDREGRALDRALVLAFPAGASATGEDLIELHCHGGRAVVAAVERALLALPNLRPATGGEFTRRALLNGRIDLAQVEALGDLLRAETESERIAAIAGVEGMVSRLIGDWQNRLIALSAQVEAAIDYDDEDDVASNAASMTVVSSAITGLRAEMEGMASAPTVERRRDGIRVVLAGPRNAGKSTLFNLLARREAAIVSSIAGTTRDRLEAPVQREGVAYLLIDTAGLVDDTTDPIEAIGIERSRTALAAADLVLWVDDTSPVMPAALWIWSRGDLAERDAVPPGAIMVRHDDPSSIERLWNAIASATAGVRPAANLTLNERQSERIASAAGELVIDSDELVVAEALRRARLTLDSVCQAVDTDQLLDRLFSDFCVGK